VVTGDFPLRPSSEAVHDALISAGFYPENEVANVLASELLCLEEENGRLQDQILIRDMQLAAHQELLDRSEAKCDELRGRWDRAEHEREELKKLLEQTRTVATQRVELAIGSPRYSTRLVDTLLAEMPSSLVLTDKQWLRILEVAECVRASREPRL